MPEKRTLAIVVTSFVLAVFGLVLAVGGVQLFLLGGSAFYLLAGAAFLATAVLLFLCHRAALWIYAGLVVVALAWAVWEIGFDWWQLVPRGGLLIAVGLWLLTPPIRGRLQPGGGSRDVSPWPLAVPVVAAIAVALYSMTTDPHGMIGELPTARSAGAFGGSVPDGDWPMYGRTSYGQRYSPLDQVTKDNVANLKVAWQYRTGDVKRPGETAQFNSETTPLKIGNSLYICTPHNLAIALDAVTGKELWKFDAKTPADPNRTHQTCRGVAYYRNADAATGSPCAESIYLATADARLIALDAPTGRICPEFGDQGAIHLGHGMKYNNPSAHYYATSPPAAVAGKLIVSGLVDDNFSTKEQSGVVRAFDTRTGALIWNWDSGNPDDTAPLSAGETYTTNSPNSWSVSSFDEQLGMIYLPMGNQTPDSMGKGRSAAVEKYSSSVVALDIATGRVRWVRQLVHHDIWDMDVPAQPVLFDLRRADGSVIPALASPTKQGDIYVLDRRNGEPIIPVKEVAAPGGGLDALGPLSPTQPESDLSFYPGSLREKDMWGVSLFDQLACRIKFRSMKYAGRYTPPSVQGTIVYPGVMGVFNWGSVAVDPERQVMFSTPVSLAFTNALIPRADMPSTGERSGEQGLLQNEGTPFGERLAAFLSPLMLPCQAPPWGYVAGVDLGTGKIKYRHKNGTVRDSTPLPLPFELGMPALGGPILTRGGVAFYSGALDNYLRAYDVTKGDILWVGRLPAGGQATPITYMGGDSNQYIVVNAGGNESVGTVLGDYIVAYSLAN